jgi:hypothetical protein
MGFRRRKVNQRVAAGSSLRSEDDVEYVDAAGNASGLEKVIASRQLSRVDDIERKSRIALVVIAVIGSFMLAVVIYAVRAHDRARQ